MKEMIEGAVSRCAKVGVGSAVREVQLSTPFQGGGSAGGSREGSFKSLQTGKWKGEGANQLGQLNEEFPGS